MAVRPMINTIKADIKNVSIYLRSTKKFGKTTLFRDVILEKYGDPSRGLLIGLGSEVGYTMLDNINAVQVTNYEELAELINWLISTKGKEHNIEIVAFDTVDELALITDAETIRIHNKENPTKKVKSIKAALGGFTAGEKYSANDIIKPLINKVRNAGFGVWCLSHTKFKNIKTKGTTDTEGYMQLTSNLGADYESAFGDCLDVVLTGVVDKEIENKEVNGETKRFSTGTTRKLYFRETELIDAGGRFAFGTVPEYLEFNKANMAADFIKVVEEGMEKSKTVKDNVKSSAPKPTAQPKKEEVIPEEPVDEPEDEPVEEVVEEESVEEIDDIFAEEPSELSKEDKFAKVKEKTSKDDSFKTKVVAILKENGVKAFNANMDDDTLDALYALV